MLDWCDLVPESGVGLLVTHVQPSLLSAAPTAPAGSASSTQIVPGKAVFVAVGVFVLVGVLLGVAVFVGVLLDVGVLVTVGVLVEVAVAGGTDVFPARSQVARP